MTYLKTLFSLIMLKSFVVYFFSAFGLLALLLGVANIAWPQQFNFGVRGIIYFLAISLIYALYKSWPRTGIKRIFSDPDFTIEIKRGNIFKEKNNLIIGFSDTFDTEIGDIISADSLQGKFLSLIYKNNRAKLDEDLNRALRNYDDECSIDTDKTRGKNKRYPIGTVVALNGENRRFFCCAYSIMNNDLTAQSDIDKLWHSINSTWNKIHANGELRSVSMPVIGTGLSRVMGITHPTIIKLMILSFVINSKNMRIAKTLSIIVNKNDWNKIDFHEMKNFLNNI